MEAHRVRERRFTVHGTDPPDAPEVLETITRIIVRADPRRFRCVNRYEPEEVYVQICCIERL